MIYQAISYYGDEWIDGPKDSCIHLIRWDVEHLDIRFGHSLSALLNPLLIGQIKAMKIKSVN
jgi:hypothetical protein